MQTSRGFTLWHKFFGPENEALFRENLRLALLEDGPELTAAGIFPREKWLSGIIRAKENSLVAGLPIVGLTLKALGQPFSWFPLASEGGWAQSGETIAKIFAPARALLKAERVILNYMTHLSGIANLTAKYVEHLKGAPTRLLDTRKTLPGLRWPEKYATQLAGCVNHRMNLAEMLMLKDNHIDAAGSITAAVRQLRSTYPDCPPIEVECRELAHVQEAVAAKVDRIMLDNMSLEKLKDALALIPPEIEAEVSGGVTLENIRSIAMLGPRHADFISVGRLTHSAPAADFSMAIAQ